MKNRRKWLFLLLLLGLGWPVTAQTADKYSFPATYNQTAAQGMAIYKHFAFLLNNGGHCRIYNLKNECLEADFDMESAKYEKNHCNNASFGVEFPTGNKEFPAFYVAECYGERRCFVESVTRNGSQLIQVLKIEGTTNQSFDWVVDRKQKYLYAIGRPSDAVVDSIGTKIYRISKFPLPSLDRKEVVFTDADILEQFEIGFHNLSQGASIRENYLYLPVGRHSTPGEEKYKDGHRDVIIVNLKTKQVEKVIDVQDIVAGEPEDIDFYGNNLMMYCGQKDGGVYNLKKIYNKCN
jgi:hypothetical protein